MHFSITCGLFLCVTMLFFLPVQGQLDLDMGTDGSACCNKVSTATIRKPVKECYEQLPNTLPLCPMHAYIFITDDDEQYCVDPHAKWLQTRLDKLKKKGKHCRVL
ncbi:C-C motif chemokine 8-like [Larimichthys crocea]|uniref:C-C motif chemokine 8-like n=1 Tax=Larimichthys crocea TaxID=215358 RepID=UPI000F5D5E74|nr:C-C motif chemokine 8-like [Larimichthys crocea]